MTRSSRTVRVRLLIWADMDSPVTDSLRLLRDRLLPARLGFMNIPDGVEDEGLPFN